MSETSKFRQFWQEKSIGDILKVPWSTGAQISHHSVAGYLVAYICNHKKGVREINIKDFPYILTQKSIGGISKPYDSQSCHILRKQGCQSFINPKKLISSSPVFEKCCNPASRMTQPLNHLEGVIEILATNSKVDVLYMDFA